MPGASSRLRPVAPFKLVLIAAMFAGACGSPAPDANLVAAGPPDLSDLTGSWTTRVSNDEVWRGRWHLHVQGGVALMEGPDHRLRTPGLVVAAARGVVVFGPDQACEEQLAVTAGTYVYEARGQDLVFRTEGEDSCVDRSTVLTDSAWTRAPVQMALPVRIDVTVDPSCESVADGTAPVSLPQPWRLDNRTAGILLAMRRSAGEVVLLGQALPGEELLVEPRRGGYWYVTDLTGRCLSLVDDAVGVTLRTGDRPQLDRE
jgi:hypothetical protein